MESGIKSRCALVLGLIPLNLLDCGVSIFFNANYANERMARIFKTFFVFISVIRSFANIRVKALRQPFCFLLLTSCFFVSFVVKALKFLLFQPSQKPLRFLIRDIVMVGRTIITMRQFQGFLGIFFRKFFTRHFITRQNPFHRKFSQE